MKIIATGTSATLDLTDYVNIPLDGTDQFIDYDLANGWPQLVYVAVVFSGLTAQTGITLKCYWTYAGAFVKKGSIKTYPLPDNATDGRVLTGPFFFYATGTVERSHRLYVKLDGSTDTAVDVYGYVLTADATDSNGRVDVGLVGGQTPLDSSNVDDAILDATLNDHVTSGSVGAAIWI